MAKYSTGGASGGGEGDACELCGATTDDLREATVAGAELLVCQSCAPHGEADDDDGSGGGDDRSRDGVDGAGGGGGPTTSTGGSSELWDRDSSHWEEEGTDYDSDQLPYLVPDYGKAVTEARQDAGLQREELAETIDVDEDDLLAVEQGRAARANVGGSVVAKLEDYLDVELVDE
jgi:ribosome-binding protein aMBF1 (putative translation factor)